MQTTTGTPGNESALLEPEPGEDGFFDDDAMYIPNGRPREQRVCLMCGDRGEARSCPRCGSSRLIEKGLA